MNIGEAVICLVGLVEQARREPGSSMRSLIAASGYPEYKNRISEALIEVALRKQPERVQQWVGWSADKRVSAGWYITETRPKVFVVGYYAEGGDRQEVTAYDDPVKACAAFIKREVDGMLDRG